ncbi:MAG: hypothetical protein JOY71_06460 [Acetobacteraceae bacterium]|nr:hypothetical protein [Acetobacteraceae bacterium]MBV8521757.1 hypothetical protein [Acetobacteraceae bacterium]MBV8590117.1 hypothetical protein [Acetobacteraceae bacterium]
MPKPNMAYVVRQRALNGAGIKPAPVWLRAIAAAALISAAACSRQSGGPAAGVSGPPDGTVEMTQVQAAFIGSGGGGTGVLYFHGNTYPFKVGGLGIGGIGASKIEATGEVYGLQNVSQFPGAYAQGRYGFALGRESGGDLWLKNDKGVTMHLRAKREGLMLSLGGDAVVISMSPSASGT